MRWILISQDSPRQLETCLESLYKFFRFGVIDVVFFSTSQDTLRFYYEVYRRFPKHSFSLAGDDFGSIVNTLLLYPTSKGAPEAMAMLMTDEYVLQEKLSVMSGWNRLSSDPQTLCVSLVEPACESWLESNGIYEYRWSENPFEWCALYRTSDLMRDVTDKCTTPEKLFETLNKSESLSRRPRKGCYLNPPFRHRGT